MTFQSLYAVIGIPLIFILGFAGVLIPSLISRLFPKFGLVKKVYFSFFNGLAAGIILAVGWIHSVPDSQSNLGDVLTNDSMTDQYSWYTFIALMGCLITFTCEEVIEMLAGCCGLKNVHSHGAGGMEIVESKVHPHSNGTEEHCEEEHTADGSCPLQPLNEEPDVRTSSSSSEEETEQEEDQDTEKKGESKRNEKDIESQAPVEATVSELGTAPLTKMFVCFIGLSLHNVFVGLALGIADNDLQLFIALIFHQFFEGLGMGARIAMANLRSLPIVLVLDLGFACVVSIAIAVGIGIKSVVENHQETYEIIDGTFQGLSGGILVYVALVHMIRTYAETGVTGKALEYHRVASYVGLLLGAAIMAVIGIWA